jgi:hypothetical protein
MGYVDCPRCGWSSQSKISTDGQVVVTCDADRKSRFFDFSLCGLDAEFAFGLRPAACHSSLAAKITGSPQNNFKPHVIVERWRAVEWLLLNEPWNDVSQMDSALSFTSK